METTTKKRYLVALCGRTNVGKSTLFNALTEKRQALISNIAGTTRDSNLGIAEWQGLSFDLIDTAGLLDSRALTNKKITSDDIDSQTQKQARTYLLLADLIIFMVDNKDGLLAEDKDIAAGLKKNPAYRHKTIVVANKVDSFRMAPETAQFYKLGLGEPHIISAATGMGTGDLLDVIVTRLKESDTTKDENLDTKEPTPAPEDNPTIRLCIVGQPNVGKSSLLNSLLGYERVIVSPTPHTTREPQSTSLKYKDREIVIVDTAGINRKRQKANKLEQAGILKSLKSLDRADIALLVLDISQVLTHQDAKLIQEIVDRGKSLFIIANKWDLVSDRDTKKWTEVIYDKLPFAAWAPIQFISAKTGEKVAKVLDTTIEIAKHRQIKLSDSQCEKFLKAVVKIHKPAKGKGLKAPRIYEFKQTKDNPPHFVVRIGPNDDLHFSYIRFMANRLRERHSFVGTPLRISVTKDRKSHTTYNE